MKQLKLIPEIGHYISWQKTYEISSRSEIHRECWSNDTWKLSLTELRWHFCEEMKNQQLENDLFNTD